MQNPGKRLRSGEERFNPREDSNFAKEQNFFSEKSDNLGLDVPIFILYEQPLDPTCKLSISVE